MLCDAGAVAGRSGARRGSEGAGPVAGASRGSPGDASGGASGVELSTGAGTAVSLRARGTSEAGTVPLDLGAATGTPAKPSGTATSGPSGAEAVDTGSCRAIAGTVRSAGAELDCAAPCGAAARNAGVELSERCTARAA